MGITRDKSTYSSQGAPSCRATLEIHFQFSGTVHHDYGVAFVEYTDTNENECTVILYMSSYFRSRERGYFTC